jgi:hypothetical protein
VVGQLPNPALALWLLVTLVRASGVAGDDRLLDGVALGALLVWAVDEVVRGASPFRRLLGAVIVVPLVVSVVGEVL